MNNSSIHKRLRRILTGIFKQMTDAHSTPPTAGKLIPCPFCGDVPVVTVDDVRKVDAYWALFHNHMCDDGMFVTITSVEHTKDTCFSEFCKKWNTRYTPKDLAGSFAKRGAGDILANFTLHPLNTTTDNGKD